MNVQYDFALENGALIHIDDAQRGYEGYICAGCDNRLVPKKGEVYEHHFAHHPGVVNLNCKPETAMHNLAKNAIANAHADARREGREYWLQAQTKTRCAGCVFSMAPEVYAINLAFNFGEALVEKSVAQGTVADVAFISGEQTIAIEVAVTNPPDDRKKRLYKETGVDLYVISLGKDDWDALDALRQKVVADEAYRRYRQCEQCRQLAEFSRRFGNYSLDAELREARDALPVPKGLPKDKEACRSCGSKAHHEFGICPPQVTPLQRTLSAQRERRGEHVDAFLAWARSPAPEPESERILATYARIDKRLASLN